MEIQSKVKLTRLQCDYLRTLLDQLTRELSTIQQTFATQETPAVALAEASLNKIAEQSDYIAGESTRLQRFVCFRFLQSSAAEESPPSALTTAAPPKPSSYKIGCTLDGKESSI